MFDTPTSVKPMKLDSDSTLQNSSTRPKIRPMQPVIDRARAAKKHSATPIGSRIQATYPIQKPNRHKFVRVHPNAEYHQPYIRTYTDSDTGELYYVDPDLELPEEISAETKVTDLYAAQTHDGTYFIWYVHRSDTSWYRAAKKSVNYCLSKWGRVVARKAANTYDILGPEQAIPEPNWSELPPFLEMVEDGFEDRFITNLDHPMLRKLRGLDNEDE